MRRSRRAPRGDQSAPRLLGDHTQAGQPARPSHHAVSLAMVAHPAARALARPLPDVRPEVARACPVRWDAGAHAHAGGGSPRCGEGVAVRAESSQEPEADPMGAVPGALADRGRAGTQDPPQQRHGRAGQHSEAPEECQDAGDRGTVGVHCARTGLWGGWLGNRWLYPEADANSLRSCLAAAVGAAHRGRSATLHPAFSLACQNILRQCRTDHVQ